MKETIIKEFKLELPDWYFVLIEKFKGQSEVCEVTTEIDLLIEVNKEAQVSKEVWGLPWSKNYWIIGNDGCGGVYFLNTEKAEEEILYIDHEESPTSLEDENLYIMSLKEFMESIEEGALIADQYAEEMREKVKNRKWFQIWVPKQVPNWAKEKETG